MELRLSALETRLSFAIKASPAPNSARTMPLSNLKSISESLPQQLKSMSRMIFAHFTVSNAERFIKEWCHNCLTLQTPYNFISPTEQWKIRAFSSNSLSSSVNIFKDLLDSSTTHSFRIEANSRQQAHFTASSPNRTRCTIPDNSCREDGTYHPCLRPTISGEPRTSSFQKRYQTTFKGAFISIKDIHRMCTRKLQIRLIARRPSEATLGSTLENHL